MKKRRKKLFEESLESFPDLLVSFTIEGEITYLNRTISKRPVEKVIGSSIYSFLDEGHAADMRNRVKSLVKDKKACSYEITVKPGIIEPTWLRVQMWPIERNREVIGVSAIVSDVTDSVKKAREADDAVRESEEKFRQVVYTTQDCVMMFHADGDRRFIDVNKACVDLYGYSREEWLSLTHYDITAEVEESDDSIKKTISSKVLRIPIRYHIKKDGTAFPVEISASAFKIGGRTVCCGIVRDITNRVRTEDHSRQAEKMEVIGQLAGGIAHDFNNQLGAILPCADAIERLSKDPRIKKYATTIVNATRRSADLTEKLLAFGRKGQFEFSPVDIHEVAKEVITILNHSIDKRILITERLDAIYHQVFGDKSQIQNAILNVCINARDAMPDGGEILIETKSMRVDDRNRARIAERIMVDDGLYVIIRVRDSGIGMDEEIQAKIFEPFFTTKASGKGTGMGMSAVYGTVKNHHGYIEVRSDPGRGTEVSLLLPAIEKENPIQNPDEEIIESETGTVLVVDDEELVLEAVSSVLRELGHKVIPCKDGLEAIECYKNAKGSIDVVLLDMIMPRMNGPATFASLKEIDPSVKVIICSGFSLNKEAQDILQQGALAFHKKPLSMNDLAGAVKMALGSG